jgi:NTP pyrophosphatase (non-canonical NTP hydrolase)
MTFEQYQSEAARTLNPALDRQQRMLDAAAGLAEEAGEVLGAVRKNLYQQRVLDESRIREELGDALWCIAALASTLGVSLSEIAASNIEKLRLRHPGGFNARHADE